MTGFVAPVDDILYSLIHIADASRAPDWDAALAYDILNHFSSFAEAELAPLNAIGDAQGARIENGRVHMPDGFKPAYKQLTSSGWQGLTAPEEFGGMAVSPLIAAGVSEIFAGANHAMQMICNLVPGAISLLLKFGTTEQQKRWIPRLASGDMLSTMCLTEAAAGSDLSQIACKATKSDSGWRISGDKIFISGGDQDMSRSILHLVLARSDDSAHGIDGLSLLLCPKQYAVKITRIESKIGLHASPTCQLTFDDAEAELIGVEGQGLKAMFTLMNHARLDVALQGVAHAAHAAHLAQTYADERKQGRRVDGQAALLSEHADVRRMLQEQQRLAITARSLCHIALVEWQCNSRPALVEFMTPLSKIVGSEAGIRSADLGIQVLGGYGYLTEYGLGQIWRDARITAIYEGANGIHARNLVTRGLRENGGAHEFAELIKELAQDNEQVIDTLGQWQQLVDFLTKARDPLPYAHDFATSSASLFEDAVWHKIASVAEHHPEADKLMALHTNT